MRRKPTTDRSATGAHESRRPRIITQTNSVPTQAGAHKPGNGVNDAIQHRERHAHQPRESRITAQACVGATRLSIEPGGGKEAPEEPAYEGNQCGIQRRRGRSHVVKDGLARPSLNDSVPVFDPDALFSEHCELARCVSNQPAVKHTRERGGGSCSVRADA